MEKCIQIKARYFLLLGFIFCLWIYTFSQVPAFDRMEQLYDQGRFHMVNRKAKRLLNKPEYDYSLVPKYYASMSALQLFKQAGWRERKLSEVDSSIQFLNRFYRTERGNKLKENHRNELDALQLDLNDWFEGLSESSLDASLKKYRLTLKSLFDGWQITSPSISPNAWENTADYIGLETQVALIQYASKYIGTPYLWGGVSPAGFDCSGFTSYVFLNQGKKIPRVSRDQYSQSTKIESTMAQIGDLVFFGQNGLVSHVGILINAPGQAKKMIHSSSSRGVMIQDIDQSTYYSSRVIGYGRY